MKKFLLSILCSIMLFSCTCNGNDTSTQVPVSQTIVKFEHAGHSYIKFIEYHPVSFLGAYSVHGTIPVITIVHNPDCQCHNK